MRNRVVYIFLFFCFMVFAHNSEYGSITLPDSIEFGLQEECDSHFTQAHFQLEDHELSSRRANSNLRYNFIVPKCVRMDGKSLLPTHHSNSNYFIPKVYVTKAHFISLRKLLI